VLGGGWVCNHNCIYSIYYQHAIIICVSITHQYFPFQHHGESLGLCVSGVYRSLQQSYSVSSQDVLMAMDYCEESLQEIDVTSFLQTLCGHIRVFREHAGMPGWGGNPKPSRTPATFIIGEVEEERPDDRAMASSSR